MAQYLTLEEAAERLGIPVPDFKRRLRTEWTHIRPMQDGSTQRFKEKDIEELARQIGFGSEEELTLADPSSSEADVPLELRPADDAPRPKSAGVSGKLTASKPAPKEDAPLSIPDDPLILGDQDVFLLADDEKPKTPATTSSKSSGKLSGKSKSDSDVRLEKSGKRPRVVDTGTEEEIDLAVLPSSGSSTKIGRSGKLTPSKAPSSSARSSSKLPAVPTEDSSEFELRLDPDSSDEFELSLANDTSDEISLGDLPVQGPTVKTGQSGINIGKPSDSGKSLESKKKLDSGAARKSGRQPAVRPDTGSDEDVDFELSLDQAGASSKKLGSGKKLVVPDSDSEFELTIEEGDLAANLDAETGTFSTEEAEQKGDIFETDFEIPALDDDSASQAVEVDGSDTDLDSSSDFDLAIDEPADVSVEDESASQVVVLDDETEAPAKTKKKPAKGKKKVVEEEPAEEDLVVETEADEDAVSFDDMELDESVSASKALEGVKDEEEEEEEEEKQVVVVSGTAPWGVFPALFMLPTIFIVFLAGIMGFELMQSMWGYHQSTKPSSLIVDQVATALEMKPNEAGTAGGGGGAAK